MWSNLFAIGLVVFGVVSVVAVFATLVFLPAWVLMLCANFLSFWQALAISTILNTLCYPLRSKK